MDRSHDARAFTAHASEILKGNAALIVEVTDYVSKPVSWAELTRGYRRVF